MAKAGETIYQWDKSPRVPVPAPPAGSCDCQFHIYDDAAKFSARANAPYPPITSATFTEAQRMHKTIGFDRGVNQAFERVQQQAMIAASMAL